MAEDKSIRRKDQRSWDSDKYFKKRKEKKRDKERRRRRKAKSE